MGTYRLKPAGRGRLWWAILGSATFLLILPLLINLVVPAASLKEHPVRLGMYGMSWEVPVVQPDGTELRCDAATQDFTMEAWQCGDATVTSMVVEGATDHDRTLRRMVRALVMEQAPEDTPVYASGDGRARVLFVPGLFADTWAVSLNGTGDQEGMTLIAAITGDGIDAGETYAEMIWQTFSGEAELPADLHGGRESEWDEWTPGWELEQDPLDETTLEGV